MKQIRVIALLIGVFFVMGISLLHTFPPNPVLGNVPLSEFSASRAMAYVRIIGSKPHPTGTQANGDVRQYIVNQLQMLGFQPVVQSAMAFNPHNRQAGQVHNVLVKIPGTQPGKALVLVAHYDSVNTGSGAADDGASVAAIMESLRALKTQAKLQNDLICLFTDGEETGLLGAHAFVEQHPWAKQVGLVLNFEYRGNSGAFMMFETSKGNGKLINGLADAVPTIQTNSLMYEVYKKLPNNTDFSVFKNAGIPGMNFAAIEGHKSYHTSLDRPENLNQATLQHEGDIILALAKHFGNQSLENLGAEDRIYFDLPGLGIIHYPVWFSIPLTVIVVIMFIAVCVLNYKAKLIRINAVLTSSMAFLVLIGILYGVNSSVWRLISRYHPEYQAIKNDDTFNSYCYLVGFSFLTIAISASFFLFISKYLKIQELSLGVAAIWLLLTVFSIQNGANYLFLWPLLGVLAGLFLIRLPLCRAYPKRATLVMFISSLPALSIPIPVIKNLFIALTPNAMAMIMIFVSFLLGLLLPLMVEIDSSKRGVIVSLLLSAMGFVLGSLPVVTSP